MVISDNNSGSAPVCCPPTARRIFRVYLPEAGTVEVVGTFTGWQSRPVRMQREGEGIEGPTVDGAGGWWTATVDLPPGDHEFCYLIDGSHWIPDYAASGLRRSPFGGWVSQLHVPSEHSAGAIVRFPARAASAA